jgi:hypothetical protein
MISVRCTSLVSCSLLKSPDSVDRSLFDNYIRYVNRSVYGVIAHQGSAAPAAALTSGVRRASQCRSEYGGAMGTWRAWNAADDEAPYRTSRQASDEESEEAKKEQMMGQLRKRSGKWWIRYYRNGTVRRVYSQRQEGGRPRSAASARRGYRGRRSCHRENQSVPLRRSCGRFDYRIQGKQASFTRRAGASH